MEDRETQEKTHRDNGDMENRIYVIKDFCDEKKQKCQISVRNRNSLRLGTKLVWKEGEARKISIPLELPGAKELKTTPLVFSGLLGVEETQLKMAPIPTNCLIVRGVALPIHFALGFLAVSLNI